MIRDFGIIVYGLIMVTAVIFCLPIIITLHLVGNDTLLKRFEGIADEYEAMVYV